VIGVLHAFCGRKKAAIAAGRTAMDLLPISKDAYDGPSIATKLAVIYAQSGEVDNSIQLLAQLVELPNGPTFGTLRVEPEWDPVRSDPRFERLISESKVGS